MSKIYLFYDKDNHFRETFSPETGFYMRTGVLDADGHDTGVDPFMRCFPQLIDIGIMERCVCANKCKVDCYQKAICRTGNNMSVDDYRSIMEQGKGKLFQCLSENEIVLRKNSIGFLESVFIKDIDLGDELYCPDGSTHRVYEINKKRDKAYKIRLTYGKEIVATGEHRFPTVDGLKAVNELSVGDTLLRINGIYHSNENEIDIVKIIANSKYADYFYLSYCDEFSKLFSVPDGKSVPISKIAGYLDKINYRNATINVGRSQYRLKPIWNIDEDLMLLLGHYVGNGSHRSIVISKYQTKMIEKIENALVKCFPSISYNTYDKNNTFIIELKSSILFEKVFDKLLGCRIGNEKQIPNIVYNISEDMQRAFLRGYFCDGNMQTCSNDGNYGKICFNTSSEKLYKDLCILLSSLNVDYSIQTQEAEDAVFSSNEPRIIHRKKRYRIVINNLIEIEKIKEVIADHKDAQHFFEIINSYHNEKDLRERKPCSIVSIEEIGDVNVVDINIDSHDHLFVTTNGIISHNCALGGAGDPDTHENFEDILRISREYGVVPNFTTSGIAFTPEKAELCKKYCGAVAVSEHNADYTRAAIKMLLDAGVKTNIHYVLSAESIDDAIDRLRNNGFDKGINAVVFLLYKPIGLGKPEKVLRADNPKVKEFFELVDNGDFDFKIGFDSCSCAGIVNNTSKINLDSIDFCEGGRYSMYIDAQMNAMPCSFGNQDSKWYVSLRDHTIEEAWNSDVFNRFRDSLRNSCPGCPKRACCAGGCPICREIVLCNNAEKVLV